MEIHLIQHGLAKSKAEDPDRPLTADGKAACVRVATALAEAGVRPDRILHSRKTRARETAQVFAQEFGGIGVTEVTGLDPLDDPAEVTRSLAGDETTAIVGHLPHLSRLAGLLVTGDPDREIVAFRNAGVVALRRDEDRWRVAWIVTPEVAPPR